MLFHILRLHQFSIPCGNLSFLHWAEFLLWRGYFFGCFCVGFTSDENTLGDTSIRHYPDYLAQGKHLSSTCPSAYLGMILAMVFIYYKGRIETTLVVTIGGTVQLGKRLSNT